MRYIIIQQK